MRVVLLCYLWGWVAGRLWGKQVDIAPAEGFTVGWAESGSGCTVWQG